MSWQDVRHWYMDQDDPVEEPATPCVRQCVVCKKKFDCIEECDERFCSRDCEAYADKWHADQMKELGEGGK